MAFDKQTLYSRQRLPLALLAGLISSNVVAALWVFITTQTDTSIVFIGLVLGLVVGFTVRLAGRGVTPKFGIIGGAFTALGLFIAYLGIQVHFTSLIVHRGFMETIEVNGFTNLLELMVDNLTMWDALVILFGIAIAVILSIKRAVYKPE